MNRNLTIGLIAIVAAIVVYLKMVQPPEEPPVVPPGAPVPVAFDVYRRLFPVLAAKIERIYREAGHPLPLFVYVPPEMLRQAMDRAEVRVIT